VHLLRRNVPTIFSNLVPQLVDVTSTLQMWRTSSACRVEIHLDISNMCPTVTDISQNAPFTSMALNRGSNPCRGANFSAT
jgi:hypothetical protein